MFILLSPAKKQNPPTSYRKDLIPNSPLFLRQIDELVHHLKYLKPDEIKNLMGISKELAELNHARYQSFDPNRFDATNATPAMLTFDGDVYRHLDAATLSDQAFKFAQDHLLILSGLYGLLRAFDWLQPYRLEMKTPMDLEHHPSLAQFWQQPIATWLNQYPTTPIINLASQEYSKALSNEIRAPIIEIAFKEKRNGSLKTIGVLAKRARGTMARFILEHQIKDPLALQQFNEGGYAFEPKLSSNTQWVFVSPH